MNWRLRVGLLLSAVFTILIFLLSQNQYPKDRPTFIVAWGLLPLVVAWGGMWVWAGLAGTKERNFHPVAVESVEAERTLPRLPTAVIIAGGVWLFVGVIWSCLGLYLSGATLRSAVTSEGGLLEGIVSCAVSFCLVALGVGFVLKGWGALRGLTRSVTGWGVVSCICGGLAIVGTETGPDSVSNPRQSVAYPVLLLIVPGILAVGWGRRYAKCREKRRIARFPESVRESPAPSATPHTSSTDLVD